MLIYQRVKFSPQSEILWRLETSMPLLMLLSIEDAPDTQRGQDVGREARISQALCLSSYHVSCVRLPWARLVLKAQSDWGALFAAQKLLMIEVMEIPIVFFSLFLHFVVRSVARRINSWATRLRWHPQEIHVQSCSIPTCTGQVWESHRHVFLHGDESKSHT